MLKPGNAVSVPGHAAAHRRQVLELEDVVSESVATEVTVVTSAEALLDAFVRGVRHIELREHLDLTGLNVSPSFRLGPVPTTMKSIRVRIH